MPDNSRRDPPRPPVPGVLEPGQSSDPAFDEAEPQVARSLSEARLITRRRARELAVILRRAVKRHVPPRSPRRERPVSEPPRLRGRLGAVLPWLRLIPWLLLLAFLTSFFWDFPGTTVTFFGRLLAVEGLLRILSVAGLIGFGTNWLAITMLFRPRQKRPIVPQGLIPAQRERVIYRLAEAISRELINEQLIKEKIQSSGVITRYRELGVTMLKGIVEDEEFRADLKALTADYVESVLGSESMRRRLASLFIEKVQQYAGAGLGGIALKAYRAFNEADFQRRIERAVHELPGALDPVLDRLDEAIDRVPVIIEDRADEIEDLVTRAILNLVERLDVQAMIVENAEQFDEQRLEDLLKKTSNEQLNYIKYLGGILGVIGGFVIWEPVLALAVLGAVAAAFWALDEALFRLRPAQASR